MLTKTRESMTVRSLQTIYIMVRNFEKSLNFYRKVLGSDEQMVMHWGRDQDEKGAFFELPDGTRFIISYEAPHAVRPRRQYMWLELQVEDPQAFYQELTMLGVPVKKAPYIAAGGSLAFDVTDPDGNDIRIGTRWNLPATTSSTVPNLVMQEQVLSNTSVV